MSNNLLKRTLLMAALATLPGIANAADPYTVGFTAGVTGPGSETTAPVVEAVTLYFDDVNARGGINGHPVKIMVLDSQNSPQRAAADAKQLASDKDVFLVLNASLSSAYAPVVQAFKSAGLPMMFSGGVCPAEVLPPAEALQFCTTAYEAGKDSEWAMNLVKEIARGPVKLGLVAMAIPISREGINRAEKAAAALGMQTVYNEAVPPPTPNYAPFATKIKEAGANWGYSWAPWVTQVKTFEALRSQGWDGKYLTYGHINSEDELKRIKDDGFHVFGANAYFEDNEPIHKEIRAKTQGKAKFPVTQMSEGWVAAIVLDEILKNVSWPPSKEKAIVAMNSLKVDLRGLRGGPLVWTKDNHFRTEMYYRAYRWDSGKNQIVRVKDWSKIDVK